VSALCVLLLEELGGPGPESARFTIDLVRPVTTGRLHVEGRIVRDGRRIQLLEAELRSADKLAGQCSLLRVRPQPVELPADGPALANDPPPDSPEAFFEAPRFEPGRTFFAGSGIDMRVPDPERFGAGVAWYRLALPIVPGRQPPPMARAVAAADFGNGISGFRDRVMAIAFPNADLTVHLARPPQGEWVRLQSASVWRAEGIGLTRSELADREGPVGVAQQSLVISPAPG